MTLTGDHHFYAHYVKQSGAGPKHRITAGGGGAHSMGTHSLPETIKPPSLGDPGVHATYELDSTSPTPRESEEMREGVVGAVMRAGPLGGMIGGFYALLSLAFADAVKDHSVDLAPGAGDKAYDFGRLLWDGGSTWSIALFLLLALGAGRVRRRQAQAAPQDLRRVAHTLAHVVFALAAPIVLILLFSDDWIAEQGMALGWIAAAGSFAIGCVAGPFVFGVYLLLLNRSRPTRHSGEIWGALASTEYKNFLRMRIDSEERLTIYPVGIRHPVEWKFDPNGAVEDPWFAPAAKEPEPRLIEPPIEIEP